MTTAQVKVLQSHSHGLAIRFTSSMKSEGLKQSTSLDPHKS